MMMSDEAVMRVMVKVIMMRVTVTDESVVRCVVRGSSFRRGRVWSNGNGTHARAPGGQVATSRACSVCM